MLLHEEGRAVAIYNADKKELMIVIKSFPIAAKYLYGRFLNRGKRASLYSAAKQKFCISNTQIGYKVAVRYANDAQIQLLGGDDFYLAHPSATKPHFSTLITMSADKLGREMNERSKTAHPNAKGRDKESGSSRFYEYKLPSAGDFGIAI